MHDFAREREFYQRLDWPVVLDTDDFVVFELRGAGTGALPCDLSARDACAQPAPPSAGIATSVIITVERAEDVDELTARAEAAGATLTKPPTDPEFFQGRDAYFADRRATNGRSRGPARATWSLRRPVERPVRAAQPTSSHTRPRRFVSTIVNERGMIVHPADPQSSSGPNGARRLRRPYHRRRHRFVRFSHQHPGRGCPLLRLRVT